jgi:hypothetical protein
VKNFTDNWPFDEALIVDGTECVKFADGRHLCGYTAFEKTQIPAAWLGNEGADALQYLDVHGGITYADADDDYAIFGFDCAHAGDADRVEFSDHVFVLTLAKRMRQQMEEYAKRIEEWRSADRAGRIRIIEEIRGNSSEGLGFGALIDAIGGGRIFGDEPEKAVTA